MVALAVSTPGVPVAGRKALIALALVNVSTLPPQALVMSPIFGV